MRTPSSFSHLDFPAHTKNPSANSILSSRKIAVRWKINSKSTEHIRVHCFLGTEFTSALPLWLKCWFPIFYRGTAPQSEQRDSGCPKLAYVRSNPHKFLVTVAFPIPSKTEKEDSRTGNWKKLVRREASSAGGPSARIPGGFRSTMWSPVDIAAANRLP